MPNLCTVCTSPHAATIDQLWATGTRPRHALATEFSVDYQALVRHIRYGHAQRLSQSAPGGVLLRPAPREPRAAGARPSPLAPADSHTVSSDSHTRALDAVSTFRVAFESEPMPHQVRYLEETRDMVFLKGRQIGATQAAAALAIHVARSKAGALAAIISPSERQSTEICVRSRLGLWQLGERLKQDSASLLRLQNGSRIISLPGSARGIRGYPADLLIIDEAAWVEDQTWVAARAMVAATRGRIIVQSTPGSPVGFFYDLATNTPARWARMVVRSDEARTIDPDFLAREREEMSEALYDAEYGARFPDADSIAATLFRTNDIERAFDWTPLKEANA